ncbi:MULTISPECIES: MerR family transcriptional regulator [Streptomyces]|uniref:HTH merR-type domain-containing protein n=1 Tax=Streptomyces plicatus TaxID=1922 RepID=A0ABW1Y7B8_STRPL
MAPERDAAGRRRYGTADLTRVAVILRAKEARLPLETIRSLAATADPRQRRDILQDEAEALRSRIAAAQASLHLMCARLQPRELHPVRPFPADGGGAHRHGGYRPQPHLSPGSGLGGGARGQITRAGVVRVRGLSGPRRRVVHARSGCRSSAVVSEDCTQAQGTTEGGLHRSKPGHTEDCPQHLLKYLASYRQVAAAPSTGAGRRGP